MQYLRRARSRRYFRYGSLLAAATAVTVVSACSSSSTSASAPSATAAAAASASASGSASGGGTGAAGSCTSMQTLNIAVNAPSVTYAQLLVAQADGLFAKNCLTANVNWSVATAIPATLAAGQYDIAISTITTPMSMLLSGKQTELIYNVNNNPMPAIITGKQYKTIADVQAIKGCTIFALSPGSVVYAQTVQLTKTIFTNCGVTAASTGVSALPEVNEAVSSGHFPVGVSIYQFVEPSVSANQVNLLVNPLKPTAQLTNIFHPDTFPVLAAFGLPSDLSGKQAAVTDFAKAMDQALPIGQRSGRHRVRSARRRHARHAWSPAALRGETMPAFSQ